MEAIILAGGLGTRLAAKLNGVPKAMAPVAGRPFLEILLNQLKRAGCTRAVLSVGHLHAVIQSHFGESFNGMRVEYAIEDVPLGTGGAIRAALGHITEKSVLVLNGDTFLDAAYADLMRFHEAEGAGLTMAITHRADVARYGGVIVSGGRITGAYAMEKDLRWPEALAEKFSFETDFLATEIGRIAPAAYEVDGFFLDIGVPEDLDRAQRELADFEL